MATKFGIYKLTQYIRRKASHFNPRYRLQAQLGLGIATLALFLSTLTSLAIGYNTTIQIQAERGQSLAELSHNLTELLDRSMFERYREIQIVTTLETIRNPNTPLSEKRSLIEKLQSTYPDYAWIGLTDFQGYVIASTNRILEGKDVSSRPWFKGAQAAPYVGDVHEAILLAKLLPNPTTEPLRFVDVAAPVTDSQGKLQGVLGVHLSWVWAKKVQDSLLQPVQKRSQVEVLILDQDGTVLLGPPKLQSRKLALVSIQATRTQGTGYQVENWSDGNAYLTGFARTKGLGDYPGLGWMVLVRQPTAIAFAPAKQLQQQVFLWGLMLGVLFASLGWLIIERITRPLMAIAAVADRIRLGDTQVKIPVQTGNDEVASLSQSLNKLVNTLMLQEQALLVTNEQLRCELLERQQAQAAEAEAHIALEKERELSELKSRFISMASHEFRTPLATILSSSELLENYYYKWTVEKKQQYFTRIKAAIQRMVQLLDDVLLIGKAEAGKMTFNPAPLNLRQFCNELVEEVQTSSGSQHKIDTVVQGKDKPACMDEKLLRHILYNLLSNAIKYSPAGTTIHFELNFLLKEVVFQIQDQGIGIPIDDQKHLFETFHRAKNVGTIPGTGLGLAIVKKSVDLHGGRIAVESVMDIGTTFTITLPLSFDGFSAES
ncbi:MAG TPA: sensor histidine kinase [Coleofasciculaceae cyanobacterium]|jgi:signal transduction histidine kinase